VRAASARSARAAKNFDILLCSPQELKVVDTAVANYALTTTGSVTLINGVATGTDFTNRIGRKVCWKSILIQGVTVPEDGGVAGTLGRIMLVYDSQPNGALPAVTDVLLTATSLAPLNLNNRDRFRVLWDKRVAMGYFDTTATQSVADRTTIEVRKYRKCNLETVFDGTTAAIGDIQSGSIFMLTISNQPTGTGYNLSATLRLRFTDS